MKFLLFTTGLGLAILSGFIGGSGKPYSTIHKLIIIIAVAASLALTLLPPIASGPEFSEQAVRRGFTESFLIKVDATTKFEKDVEDDFFFEKLTGKREIPIITMNEKNILDLAGSTELIILARYDKTRNAFIWENTESVNPLFTYPFIPELMQRIRILNLHVPQAWVAVMAYLVSMVFSIRYLRKRDINDDLKASASASLGLLFTILATITGMLWAKQNWGSYWNWDPRETSIFILMLIYAAYFALRSAIDNPETRARLSSVYSIFAFLTVPFFVFILPRIASGLHPGSGSDGSTGPVISSGGSMLSPTMSWAFALGLGAFTALFFFLHNIAGRYMILKFKKSDNNI